MSIRDGRGHVVRWRELVYVGLIVGCWRSGRFGPCVDCSDDVQRWRRSVRWTVQWAAVRGWLGYGGSASVQDVVHDVGGCWGVAVVGCIVGDHIHVGSARLGRHRGVAQLVRGSWCCLSGGLCEPNNGGEVHFNCGLGP